jgi:hypothetical protein
MTLGKIETNAKIFKNFLSYSPNVREKPNIYGYDVYKPFYKIVGFIAPYAEVLTVGPYQVKI